MFPNTSSSEQSSFGMTTSPRAIGLCVLVIAGLITGCTNGGGAPAGGIGAGPRPTAEDTWAIRCIAIEGVEHIRQANAYAEALKGVRGLRANRVQVYHEDGQSTVYYGRYRRLYDDLGRSQGFRPDPGQQLELIRNLSVGGRNVWPFRLATMELLPSAQRRHPEWDLAEVERGHWSLHIAVFYNTDEMRQRKRAAEQYCELLRQDGEEAYYHHGMSNSSVCVGIFPREAIRTFRKTDPLTGTLRVTDRIVDERMLALQRKYPHNLENGHIISQIRRDPRTGEIAERIPNPSFPVRLPYLDELERSVGG